MATKNLYHRRLVAESSARACWICYKPTPTVLTTPEHDDFFYICPGHLLDSKFAIARDADDLAKKNKDEEIEKEIETLKKEFQDKMKKKMDRRRQKEHEKDGNKTKEENKDDGAEDKELEKEQEEKLKALESKKEPEKAKVDGPRIFELQKHFFQMRLQRKRDAQVAKRNQERLRNPNAFPSVPKDL